MKNIAYKFSAVILFVATLVSCEEDPLIYDADNGKSFAAFADGGANLPVPADGATYEIPVNVTTRSSEDREIQISINEASTASSAEYSIDESTLVIPAGEFVGHVAVTANFEEIPDLVTNTVVIDLVGVENAELMPNENDSFALSIYKECPSDLDVEFTWVASNFVYQGTNYGDQGFPSGTDALVKTGNSSYVFESGFFDFGWYCVMYNGQEPGCGDGADGTLQLSDVCGTLSYTGADAFGDGYTIFDVEVDGPNLTYSWLSDYGEGSTVTLTRTDGQDWPENLTD